MRAFLISIFISLISFYCRFSNNIKIKPVDKDITESMIELDSIGKLSISCIELPFRIIKIMESDSMFSSFYKSKVLGNLLFLKTKTILFFVVSFY